MPETTNDSNVLRMMWLATKRLSQGSINEIEGFIRGGDNLSNGIKKTIKNDEDKIVLGALLLLCSRLTTRAATQVTDRVRRGMALAKAIRKSI